MLLPVSFAFGNSPMSASNNIKLLSESPIDLVFREKHVSEVETRLRELLVVEKQELSAVAEAMKTNCFGCSFVRFRSVSFVSNSLVQAQGFVLQQVSQHQCLKRKNTNEKFQSVTFCF